MAVTAALHRSSDAFGSLRLSHPHGLCVLSYITHPLILAHNTLAKPPSSDGLRCRD